jgi:hypothetical protein
VTTSEWVGIVLTVLGAYIVPNAQASDVPPR